MTKPRSSRTSIIPASLEPLVAQGRFDRQIALVREHWISVRRLWLGTSPPPGELLGGLLHDFWTGVGMPGLANVRPIGNDRFEFSEDGLTAVILPAYDTIPGHVVASAEGQVEELCDLVAADLDHPDHFWRRRGAALVLGSAYLEIAGQEGEPVPVFKNPLTWLRTGGAGICILDWDNARDLLLDHELIAEDLALGEQLEAALKPDIWIAA